MKHAPQQENGPALLTRVLLRVFDAMNCGGILLGKDKRVLDLNASAEKLLNSGLVQKHGQLCATDRSCDALFQTLLDQFLGSRGNGKLPSRQAFGLKRVDRCSLIVRIIPIELYAEAEFEGAALLVVLLDPEDCPAPSHDILQQVFGLTRGEAKVANRLMCGESLQEIAVATNVAVGTVRTQVRSIFHKTGMKRQAELVALLTRIAVISDSA